MRRPLYSPPDPWSLSPLLALLPLKGSVNELPALTSSLYARFEKVQALQAELNPDENKEAFKRFSAEAVMLKQVLDWLSVHPGDEK